MWMALSPNGLSKMWDIPVRLLSHLCMTYDAGSEFIQVFFSLPSCLNSD